VAKLVLSIDTEPDLPRRRSNAFAGLTNIPALIRLQERIPDVPLTLLVTQRVVTDGECLAVLERLARDHGAEIGTHLHPEETPPWVRGEPDEVSLMRLSPADRRAKLDTLTEEITARFGRPTSYRAGRWKLGDGDLVMLANRGYRVDSTVTPLVSWRVEHGPDFALAPGEPYRIDGLWEAPVTIELNRGSGLVPRAALGAYLQVCSLELLGLPRPAKRLWDAARPIRPVWFRPTYESAESMISLARRRMARDPDTLLNMMFHSNELAPGGRPFIKTQADADRIIDRVVETCRHLVDRCGVEPTTLSAAVPEP
jgi:hypothetical protein